MPGPDLERALRLLRLLPKTVGALVDLQGAEAPVHAEQEIQARQAAALEVHAHLALEGQALLLEQTGHVLLPPKFTEAKLNILNPKTPNHKGNPSQIP